ncbi:MAG: hypothetical protein Q6K90_04395 [Gloeomargarita sp. HHBFW_bins_162]
MTLALLTLHLTWDGQLSQLLPQIEAQLQFYGTPLRWAITTVTGRELTIEAVVIQPGDNLMG